MSTAVDYADLPVLLSDFADVVGVESALAIARAKGGQRVSIPANPGDSHWLVKAIGREKAFQLCQAFVPSPGIEVDIPSGPASAYLNERDRRHQIVREGRDAGKSANEIAALAGISRRSVQRQLSNIRYAEERDARQKNAP